MPAHPPPLDHEALAASMDALSYGPRIQLLDLLRVPHTLSEIRLPTMRVGGVPGRTAAMQSTKKHLAKLVESGFVRVDEIQQEGRRLSRYAVNPPQLWAFSEEVRRLSVVHAGRGLAAEVTGTVAQAKAPPMPKGPALVLVHGVHEGRAYPLEPGTLTEGAWIIGRRKGLAVNLDYDPFVSGQNAAVRPEGRGFALHDLAGSKNGTWLNWAPLRAGGSAALTPGDVIGVGRSLLCFRA